MKKGLKIIFVSLPGMFIDKIVEVAKKELSWEVDYVREAQCTKQFKELLKPYPEYFVPAVVGKLLIYFKSKIILISSCLIDVDDY